MSLHASVGGTKRGRPTSVEPRTLFRGCMPDFRSKQWRNMADLGDFDSCQWQSVVGPVASLNCKVCVKCHTVVWL